MEPTTKEVHYVELYSGDRVENQDIGYYEKIPTLQSAPVYYEVNALPSILPNTGTPATEK